MLAKFLQWTCVLAVSAWGLTAQTTALVQPTSMAVVHLRTFGMVGLAEGQSAQLNLLAPHVPASPTAAACTAAVAFLDGSGNVLKSGTLTVLPDQSASFSIDSDFDLQMASNERREIRATIQMSPAGTTIPAVAPCRLIPTLEIFDNLTKKTDVILTRAHFVREPAPAPAPATNNPS